MNSMYGATVGAVLGPALSYFYVAKVLLLKWYQNVAIVLLLPFVAGFVAAPVLYLYFVVFA